MKKHLIAAGVVAVFAAPAMAQNVQIYGTVDVNYVVTDTDNAKSDSAMGSAAATTLRTPVLGFRGSEDLGGGLKAEFQLEGRLNPELGSLGAQGTTTNGTTATQTYLFNREAWVGLSGAFGAVRFGTTDVTTAQAIDSKVGQAGVLSDNYSGELGSDVSKTIRYTSPTFSGISAQVGYASPQSTSSAGGESTANSVTSLYLQYEEGKLGAYAGYTSKKISTSYDQKETTLGVKYDFGVVSVGAMLQHRDSATNNGEDISIQMLSAQLPLGNGYALHGVYRKQETDLTTASTDGKAFTIAATKALSKRTSVYAGIRSTDLESTAENDSKNYIVGVSHTF